MTKITVEYLTQILESESFISRMVELINEKLSETDHIGELICPHCNSTNTDIIHAISHCGCSDCNNEFEA